MKKIVSTLCALAVCAFTASQTSAEMLASYAKVKMPYVITVPPTVTVTSAFLKLTNSGEEKITVTKVVTNVSSSAEIHNHVHADGMMKMVHLPSLDIEPHQTISFEPGSYHIMIIGLEKPLKDGEIVQVTFSFNDGSTVTVNMPVRDIRKMHGHGQAKQEGHAGHGDMNNHDMGHGEMKHPEMEHGEQQNDEAPHDMHHGH